MLPGGKNQGLCCQVEDSVGVSFYYCPGQHIGVEDIDLARAQPSGVLAFNRGVMEQAPDRHPSLEEIRGEVRADKAPATGDETALHRRLTTRFCAAAS